MTYSIKEIFYSLQGEGANSGRAAVFCRFTGCNLWSGREKHRSRAVCRFCDTDFVGSNGLGGGKFREPRQLAEVVARAWQGTAGEAGRPLVVCTGGEPLLQLDVDLIAALQDAGFEVAVETNGTRLAPQGIDWLCVSPKAGAELLQRSGNELKLVYPQPGAAPEQYVDLAFEQFFLQPMDGPQREAHIRQAVAYCLAHPKWRLSLQTHKLLGIR
jgi:7-carboxy-7-deazaguanine synthase (Cx14CxxC type)